MHRAVRVLLPIVVFAVVAIAWTYPLVTHRQDSLPGIGAGDNVAFLWNFWWMRMAGATGGTFFHTPFLFAPFGVNLTLHTHTALASFVGASVFAKLSLIEARNVFLLIELCLNGWLAYLLACRAGADRRCAYFAGVVFACSPYMAAHLNGHFNLTAAWVIPFFALAASEAVTGSFRWGVVAGAVLGTTFYVDYYYVVYEGVLGAALLVSAMWEIRASTGIRRRSLLTVSRWVAGAILADLVLIAAIRITGGGSFQVLGREISAHGIYNPLQVLWALAAVWILLRVQPRLIIAKRAPESARRAWLSLATGSAVAFVIAAPILWNAGAVLRAGDYTTQQYFWRSAPSGIDLATLVLGNPFHGLWGASVRSVYTYFDIDQIESGAWLGVLPLVLAILAVPLCRGDAYVRRWAVLGAAFLMWALGHHLMVFGKDTGMILPETLVRYVPFAANARIPGRAMVVVYLAMGVLGAKALTVLSARARYSTMIVIAAVVLVAVDFNAAPFVLVKLDRPTIYDVVRNSPEPGALCELPLGLADGFGDIGHFDRRALFYQTIHGRPLAGGFVARLPASVVARYRADPLLQSLLELSRQPEAVDERPRPPGREEAIEGFRRNNIRFVVLDRASASAGLADYVDRILPLNFVTRDGTRDLFIVAAP